MIHFFGDTQSLIYAVDTGSTLSQEDIQKLEWLFGNQPHLNTTDINYTYFGTRATMVTPWSTNAVEITQNMGIEGIRRIEMLQHGDQHSPDFDPMFYVVYPSLNQDIFKVDIQREPIQHIEDIAAYNEKEGLAMNEEEVAYLESLSKKLGRKLTDSEVFGFSQVNSEHCRHKIFNGIFEIDGEQMPSSLFKLIKKTTAENPNGVVSAYKDNVAFFKGPKVTQFAPQSEDKPDFYKTTEFDSVLSLKAETHNFPTTVEPFNGAGTGSGGEVRDRLAGGRGSIPLAGSAVYMTAYSRLKDANRPWEKGMEERKWLYQTPLDILIKASDGAADFGNKFGQPVISGSILTFEHEENGRNLGYDKVIMMAGGIGFGKEEHALKHTPKKGDQIVVMGGDNYRIGMGGAAVSSADTGEFSEGIELNAVQRSNPEMQKRVANAIRAMVERSENPIVSIHDHGAGGHLNCLSELVEETGGKINLDKLPVGDKTLSAKEIIGNESQERMGLVISKDDLEILQRTAAREQAPMYVVGEVTDDMRFSFKSEKTGEKPVDFALMDLFGSSPTTIMKDKTVSHTYKNPEYSASELRTYLEEVLQLEAVGSKDWIINKTDRSVSGKVAKQQVTGPLQLPLNNCGVMALDYNGKEGIASSVGHSPLTALIDPAAGSKNAITESLTNIVWAPLAEGLKGVSLSANWMWPCNNPGEDARLYKAVEAVSDFSIALGINVPTGKDSLSMTQKYDDKEVVAPGTVIITAAAHCKDIRKVVEPTLKQNAQSIYYIDFSQDQFKLGGSSFAQTRNAIGKEAPTVKSATYVSKAFEAIQKAIDADLIAAGHDIGSGGLITTLLEMCFADSNIGASFQLDTFEEEDLIKILFAENSAVVIQTTNDSELESLLNADQVHFHKIGTLAEANQFQLKHNDQNITWKVSELRKKWAYTSYLLDCEQSGTEKAKERYTNFDQQPIKTIFPTGFTGKRPEMPTSRKIKAAIIREKGSNSEREMANALYQAGFDVKDVHMTDLMEGRETLEDIQFLAAVGGFSNSDVLGSAKGWAGTFKYNKKANQALRNFFDREDTLSLGVCNGCQLFLELGLINPEDDEKPKMVNNESGRFESSFTSVDIPENNSVMLKSLSGSSLGIWISHGEGRFEFPKEESHYNIVGKYTYDAYPANPNGSQYKTAMLADRSGRHLAMMPHLERSIFPWNWSYYPEDRKNDEVTPWLEAFTNAREWLENK